MMVSGIAARLCMELIIFADVNTRCLSSEQRGLQFGSAGGGIFGGPSLFGAVLCREDIRSVWRH